MDVTLLVRTLEGLTAAIAVAAVLATTTGLGLTAVGRTSRARALGHPLVALVGAALVVGIGALGQWAITHGLIDATFASTDDGWRRVASAQADAAAAMTLAASLQRFVAMTVAVLIPVAWLAAWRHDPARERSAIVASVAATFAASLPVLVGCGGVMWMADIMTTLEPGASVWPAWHALEVSKWAVAGIAAVGLMAATPIVMHAASRGNVVGARTSQLSQVILLVGLAAWSTSRFANEDLVRGPMASLDRGEGPWRHGAAQVLPEPGGLELPTASRCTDDPVDPNRQRVLTLQLDAYGDRGDETWPQHRADDPREWVLVAAVDRRAPASAYQPALLRAQELGVRRIALVTTHDDTEPSLTLGTLHSQVPCVLGWLGIDHALRLSASGSRWTTLAYAASHPR